MSDLFHLDSVLSRNVIDWNANARIIRGIMDLGAGNSLFKGVIPATIIWYLWGRTEDQLFKRSQLISTFLTATIAIAMGRILANFLPFRVRPIGTLEIAGPYLQKSEFVERWSSMPSDHAVMFFALAMCIFMISKIEGILLLLHAVLIVSASRVLLGLHFLSDVVVGALVGVVLALTLMPILTRLVIHLMTTHNLSIPPRFGYPLLFLITFQFATMFDDLRSFIERLFLFLF